MPEPTTQCKMPLLFIFMNSFVAILTNMKTKINYLILKRCMFLLELYLFFIHRDFVKGICKERSKRNQYVRPTCIQHQAFFLHVSILQNEPIHHLCPSWYPEVLSIFIIFIQYQATFSQNAFLLQFLARLTRHFFLVVYDK